MIPGIVASTRAVAPVIVQQVVVLRGNGDWTVPADVSTLDRVILIAGGGGGGFAGGGGGAGEVIELTNVSVTPEGTISYSVGFGGSRAVTSNGDGINGADTVWDATTAEGGGFGGGFDRDGGDSHNGGGAGGRSGNIGGVGANNDGGDAASGLGSGDSAGGGGGGQGAPGGDGTGDGTTNVGGDGGIGIDTGIASVGESGYVAAGGGAEASENSVAAFPGDGGLGGGGDGGDKNTTSGQDGLNDTGSGAGGGGWTGDTLPGKGARGSIILVYSGSPSAPEFPGTYSPWDVSALPADVSASDSDYTLTRTAGSNGTRIVKHAVGKSTGKFAVRALVRSIGSAAPAFGLSNSSSTGSYLGQNGNGWSAWTGYSSGSVNRGYHTGSATNLGDIGLRCELEGDTNEVMLEIDLDNDRIWMGMNGVWYNGVTPSDSVGTGAIYTNLTGELFLSCDLFYTGEITLLTPDQFRYPATPGFTPGWPD